jgi:hypothetical protein
VAADAARRLRVDAFAARNNFSKNIIYDDGRVVSLADVVDGIPKFRTTRNAVSADTISTDEVYSGGSLGLTLDGSGVTLGIWDGGDVRMTHTEFTTGGQRITDKDGISPLGINSHPTHVAGTLVARGVNATARGMAHAALLHAYDWENDLSEMTTAASVDSLKISNHSYGWPQGWDTVSDGVNTYWAWYGDVTVSQTEDYEFGFYSNYSRGQDVLTYNAPNYLPVWAAGNERQPGSITNGPPSRNPASLPLCLQCQHRGLHPGKWRYKTSGRRWNRLRFANA